MKERIMGAVARGWCHEKNSHKVMDTDLALAISEEVLKEIGAVSDELQKTAHELDNSKIGV